MKSTDLRKKKERFSMKLEAITQYNVNATTTHQTK